METIARIFGFTALLFCIYVAVGLLYTCFSIIGTPNFNNDIFALICAIVGLTVLLAYSLIAMYWVIKNK